MNSADPGKTRRPSGGSSSPLMFSTPNARNDSLSLQPDDPLAKRYFRSSLLLVLSSFLVMLFFFVAAFFFVVRGAERTVVPSVVGMELSEALMTLQGRELYPRLQLRFTGTPDDKGSVIAQSLEPGLYVKAGRRVLLTVSRGATSDTVEDYVGRTVTEVRARLASLYSTFSPLLVIDEPITYIVNEAPAGTVLSQDPEPGTSLGSESRPLLLVASRGIQEQTFIMSDFSGSSAESAVRTLADIPLPFLFIQDQAAQASGFLPRVTSQTPEPDTEIPASSRVILRYSEPINWPLDMNFGLFSWSLPEYPVPVRVELLVRETGTEDRSIFSMPHPGGQITYPYVLPVGSRIVLLVEGNEIGQTTVGLSE